MKLCLLTVVISMFVAACGDPVHLASDAASPDVASPDGRDACLVCAAGASCDPAAAHPCACPAGFTGDGLAAGTGCTDLDECAAHTDGCVAGVATCTNTTGGFDCECMPGFIGDGLASGTRCVDLDECASASTNDCDGLACVNTNGSFRCDGLYAIDPYDGVLARLDPVTFELLDARQITASGVVNGVNAMARDPLSGTIYSVAKVAGLPGRTFGTLDLKTAEFTAIGSVDRFTTLAFTPSGTLFGVTGDGALTPETLFTFDLDTGTPTVAATLGNGGDGEAICVDPDDQRMYHWSGNDAAIMESFPLDRPTAIKTVSDNLGTGEVFGCRYVGDHTFLLHDIQGRVQLVTTEGFVSPVPDAVAVLHNHVRVSLPATMSARHTVRPTRGTTAGGTEVTIRGLGLTGSTEVWFGGAAAVSFTIDSDTQITAIAPPAAVGTVDVTVKGVTPYTSSWRASYSYANPLTLQGR